MEYIGIKGVAATLNVTPYDIKKFVREGMPKVSNNKFVLLDCVHWYIDYLKYKNEYANITEIAELIGKTERYVNKLTSEKNLPKEAHGKYNRIKFINAYIQFKDDLIKQAKSGGETASDAKTRLLRDQADLKHLEKLRELKKVIPVETFEDVLNKLTDLFVASVDSIPYRNAAKIYAAREKKEINNILQNNIKIIKDELHRKLANILNDTAGISPIDSRRTNNKNSRKSKAG